MLSEKLWLNGDRDMPVHGSSKVESKCLAMCARVEPFMGLGTRGKDQKVPPASSGTSWLATTKPSASERVGGKEGGREGCMNRRLAS